LSKGVVVPELFEATKINSMTIKNRFVRSATWEGMAKDDGTCTKRLVDLMSQLAQGGVGLIITGHAYIQKIGKAGPWQSGIYEDRLVPGLRAMTDAVHKRGGKIVLQLAHAGMYANTGIKGDIPFAPSLVSGFRKSAIREMTLQDIQHIVEAFGSAAKRAKRAGFDAVQIHAAHGYLLSQFLSPAFNKRQDQYGGSIENRATVLLEILKSIRKRVGQSYPVLIKMNTRDFLEGGLKLDDSIKAAAMMEKAGIDAVELSGGTIASGKEGPIRTGIVSGKNEAYFKDAASAFKKKIDLPIILVGGIRSFSLAQQLVNDNIADYISMSRPFIREPDLIKRWKAGDYHQAACLSDSKCFIPARKGKGIYCVMEKRLSVNFEKR
jgi:2,4-dienoyl-CoA reductase-like NADH-dependent reductase (Old Yellow Enzyme family)